MIRLWSTTASGNSNVAGINFSEGQNPSTVNNSAREMMSQVRDEYTPERWGWVACSATASVNSQTVFKLTGNQASDYVANRKVKLTGGSTTLYATIVSSSFTTETTITITGASGSLSSSMSIAWLSTVYSQNLPANVITTSGTSTFTSEAVFLATASFAGAVKVSGTLSVGGDIVALGDLTVAGSATFSGTVAMLTALNVSGTLNVGTLLVGGVAPVTGGGWTVIGSTAIGVARTTEVKFSGSWTAYSAFKLAVMSTQGSNTTSVNIRVYSDGGTTPFLAMNAGYLALAASSYLYEVIGNGPSGSKLVSVVGTQPDTSLVFRQSVTANTDWINCIGWVQAAGTASAGTLVLFAMKG